MCDVRCLKLKTSILVTFYSKSKSGSNFIKFLGREASKAALLKFCL